MTRIVELVQYEPRWPWMFKQESKRVSKSLGGEMVQISHIGSTAIPGIKAKPTIDSWSLQETFRKGCNVSRR